MRCFWSKHRISRMQALEAIVYQAVRNSVTRTDTWLCLSSTHCQSAVCKASAAMQSGRHACIPVTKAKTTSKQKRCNPLSKLIDAGQSSSPLAHHQRYEDVQEYICILLICTCIWGLHMIHTTICLFVTMQVHQRPRERILFRKADQAYDISSL